MEIKEIFDMISCNEEVESSYENRLKSITSKIITLCKDTNSLDDFITAIAMYCNFIMKDESITLESFEERKNTIECEIEKIYDNVCDDIQSKWSYIKTIVNSIIHQDEDEFENAYDEAEKLKIRDNIASLYLFLINATKYFLPVNSDDNKSNDYKDKMWKYYFHMNFKYQEYAINGIDTKYMIKNVATDKNLLPYIDFWGAKNMYVNYIIYHYNLMCNNLGERGKELASKLSTLNFESLVLFALEISHNISFQTIFEKLEELSNDKWLQELSKFKKLKPKNFSLIAYRNAYLHIPVFIYGDITQQRFKLLIQTKRINNKINEIYSKNKNAQATSNEENEDYLADMSQDEMLEFFSKIYIPQEQELEFYQNQAKEDFPKFNRLNKKTQEYIPMGLYLYNSINKLHSKHLDDVNYAPFILQYCKALECELLKSIFKKFRKKFKASLRIKNMNFEKKFFHNDSDIRNAINFLNSKFVPFIKQNKNIELGGMYLILFYMMGMTPDKKYISTFKGLKKIETIPSNEYSSYSLLIIEFKKFLENFFKQSELKSIFSEIKLEEIRNYRNDSAHTSNKLQTIDDANNLKKMIENALEIIS